MTQNRSLPESCRRIFCIGCNYAEHIREMGNPPDEQCVIFMKPPECLVTPGTPLRLPRGLGAVHHEVELVVQIGDEGRDIPENLALEHISGFTLGLDMTLRDVQGALRKKGHPWELSKAFEQSAPLGEMIPFDPSRHDLSRVEMTCRVNDELRQQGCTSDMLFSVNRLIAILSRTWTLLPGDLIFTGTPPGVGPVIPGDEISIESPATGVFVWPCV